MSEPLHEHLSEALYAIRAEVGRLPKDGENPHFGSKFTTLASLVERVDSIAHAHGVVVRHILNLDVLRRELWFNGKVHDTYDIQLPNPQGTAQGLGSAISYMKRYDLVTTFGLVSEDMDDDGNEASRPVPARNENGRRPVPASVVSRPSPITPAARVGADLEPDEEF